MRITNRTLWILVALATLALGGGAYAAPQTSATQTSAKTAAKRTIHLREASEAPKLTVVDTGDPGPSPGDQVVTTDGLVDENGAAAGSLSQVCTIVTPAAKLFASTFYCVGSFDLAGGSITVEGPFVPTAAVSTQAVTGGTGEFTKARGDVAIATEADTITVDLA